MDPMTGSIPASQPPEASLEARFSLQRGDFQLDTRLEAPASGVTAIFGTSGSGKTTLLRMIAGLEPDPSGYLRVGDVVWQDGSVLTPTHEREIGYVFQEPSLFEHLSVRGNLEYPLRRVPEIEQRVSFEDTIDLLGVRALLDRHGEDLSGGERQRVAIARALLASPRLLLLDEPLAGLDDEAKRDILPYLERVVAELDIPALYVSHSADEVARFADHLALLENGRIVAAGPVDEMLTRLDLPLSQADDAKAIVEARVVEHDEAFHLTHLEFPGGRIAIARNDLDTGRQVRLRILARDVSLTLEHQSETSILNILPVVVDELVEQNAAQVLVRLSANGVPLLARITRKSTAALDVTPGQRLWAQVKTVALLR